MQAWIKAKSMGCLGIRNSARRILTPASFHSMAYQHRVNSDVT